MGDTSRPLPRLLVVKGTFAQFGGAERDLINNLPAWSRHFDITLATLNLPTRERAILDEMGINYLTPVKRWVAPKGAWAEARALASRSAVRAWLSMLEMTEQVTGLREVLANVDAVHVTSGVASLEFTGLVSTRTRLHYHCLEPHRGLYEDVLHRTLSGAPKRNLLLTSLLLGKQRRRDQKFVSRLARRRNCAISGNSRWIQKRISEVYGIESNLLLPTVNLDVWQSGDRGGGLRATAAADGEGSRDAADSEGSRDAADSEGGSEDDAAAAISEYVVTIGRASHVKGTWETLEMLQGTGLTLALVGGGDGYDLARLTDRADELGVRLDIQPRLSQPDLVALVRGALAVVSLAYDEPFGLTPIEAQAAGTPALMVAEGGFRFTVEDGISGRLLRRGDWKAWHDALEQARDPTTRRRWAEGGRTSIMGMGLTPDDQAHTLLTTLGFSYEEE